MGNISLLDRMKNVIPLSILEIPSYNLDFNRACKSRARKRGWGQLGAGGPYSPCYRIGLRFVFGCNNRTVPV